jgi:hypothetical protein
VRVVGVEFHPSKGVHDDADCIEYALEDFLTDLLKGMNVGTYDVSGDVSVEYTCIETMDGPEWDGYWIMERERVRWVGPL